MLGVGQTGGKASLQCRDAAHLSSRLQAACPPLTSKSISGYFRPLLFPRHLVFPPSSSWHQNPFFGSNLWRWRKPVDGTWPSPPLSLFKAVFTGSPGTVEPVRETTESTPLCTLWNPQIVWGQYLHPSACALSLTPLSLPALSSSAGRA